MRPGRFVGLIAFGIGITELYRTAAYELQNPDVEQVVILYATRTWEEQQAVGNQGGSILFSFHTHDQSYIAFECA